jgi:hypothetical protein
MEEESSGSCDIQRKAYDLDKEPHDKNHHKAQTTQVETADCTEAIQNLCITTSITGACFWNLMSVDTLQGLWFRLSKHRLFTMCSDLFVALVDHRRVFREN